MTIAGKSGSRPARSLPEALTRTLRHDVGDLLQTIYATVAILQKRLPAEFELERRIIADLRTRAEGCKNLLDTIHDFVCPLTLSLESVDLPAMAARLAETYAARYPQVQVHAEALATQDISGDPKRLAHVGGTLLANACESGAKHVRFETRPGPGEGQATWTISDDGPGVGAEDLERLFNPFFSTRHGHLGLGLALARKLVLLHGGQLTTENLPGGGFRACVTLPRVPPENVDFRQEALFSSGV
jgi:signal transduction histidine kinase